MKACVHLSKVQKKSKEKFTSHAASVIDDQEDELNVEIETGQYTGRGSGQQKLANGRVDPKDAIRSEAYYAELLKRFYESWNGDYGAVMKYLHTVHSECERCV
jgi:hypothetical protein